MNYLIKIRTDVDELINEIVMEEPIITENRKPQLKALINSTENSLKKNLIFFLIKI